MSKIESLTPEQEQLLIKHRNEYLQWGLSCEPMNQDAVKVTIGEMYSRIGKNVPRFWFCQSPAQMLIVISILKSKPYLKMLNPSIGTYHIEGVPPDCDTVEKAITWRNQTSEIPVILT